MHFGKFKSLFMIDDADEGFLSSHSAMIVTYQRSIFLLVSWEIDLPAKDSTSKCILGMLSFGLLRILLTIIRLFCSPLVNLLPFRHN
jgi:hypothetical protein